MDPLSRLTQAAKAITEEKGTGGRLLRRRSRRVAFAVQKNLKTSPKKLTIAAQLVKVRAARAGDGGVPLPHPPRDASPRPPPRAHPLARLQNRHVSDAIVLTQSKPKKALGFVFEALKSARANAVNNLGLDPAKLVVHRVVVGKGTYLKRILPHGRGRAGRMFRYR